MQENEFLKYYLEKELEKLDGRNIENLKTCLALMGLEKLRINKKNVKEIDLKKFAGEIKSRFDSRMVIDSNRRGLQNKQF
jgi:hypothetical protein